MHLPRQVGKTGVMSKDLDLAWLNPSLASLRREERGVVSGLSLAIAKRLRVDVILVRVAFIVLGLSAGLGVGLYFWASILSIGPSGRRPVERLLPGFLGWSEAAQKIFVVASLLFLLALTSAFTPLPWFAGVATLVIIAMVSRGRRDTVSSLPSPSAAPVARSDDDLVAAWRSDIARASGPLDRSVLPEVDLYSDDADDPMPVAPPAPRPRPGWGIGLAIIVLPPLLGLAVFFSLDASPIMTLATVTGAGALLTLGYAVAVRRRRVPRPALVFVALSMIASGWLAAQAAVVEPAPAEPGVMSVRVVGERQTITLTEEDLRGVDTLRITAVGADVFVRLPGPVHDVSPERNVLSMVSWGSRSNAAPFDLQVEVDAVASRVDLDI